MATTAQQHNSYWPRQPRNLLNHIVDDMAREKPEAIYAELPLSATSFDGGFRRISYRDLSNAINGMAWWLNKTLGPGQNFETLAYIGPTDMRHSILLLGAVKAGFKVCHAFVEYLRIYFSNAGEQNLDAVHIAT